MDLIFTAVFIVVSAASYHDSKDLNFGAYNNNHNAVGVEYSLEGGGQIGCLRFVNSFFVESVACGYLHNWNGPGVKLGMTTGYGERQFPRDDSITINKGQPPIKPYAMPVYVLDTDSLQIELSYIPRSDIIKSRSNILMSIIKFKF